MGHLFSVMRDQFYRIFTDSSLVDEPITFTQVPSPYLDEIDGLNFLTVISFNIPTKGTHYYHEWKYRRTGL